MLENKLLPKEFKVLFFRGYIYIYIYKVTIMVFLLLLKLKIPYFYFSSPTFVFSLISFKL